MKTDFDLLLKIVPLPRSRIPNQRTSAIPPAMISTQRRIMMIQPGPIHP
jgi:hypothetical protein